VEGVLGGAYKGGRWPAAWKEGLCPLWVCGLLLTERRADFHQTRCYCTRNCFWGAAPRGNRGARGAGGAPSATKAPAWFSIAYPDSSGQRKSTAAYKSRTGLSWSRNPQRGDPDSHPGGAEVLALVRCALALNSLLRSPCALWLSARARGPALPLASIQLANYLQVGAPPHSDEEATQFDVLRALAQLAGSSGVGDVSRWAPRPRSTAPALALFGLPARRVGGREEGGFRQVQEGGFRQVKKGGFRQVSEERQFPTSV
jgi:hypothetical protein